jgi:hypothetical protein
MACHARPILGINREAGVPKLESARYGRHCAVHPARNAGPGVTPV